MRIEGANNLLMALVLTIAIAADSGKSSNTVLVCEHIATESKCLEYLCNQTKICSQLELIVTVIPQRRRKRFVHKFVKRLIDRIPSLAGTGDGGQFTYVLVNTAPDFKETTNTTFIENNVTIADNGNIKNRIFQDSFTKN
jgi:hypothetical protein